MAIKNIKKTITNGLVKQANWTDRRKLGTANILNKLDKHNTCLEFSIFWSIFNNCFRHRMQYNRAWLQVLVSPSLLEGYAIYD